MNRKVWARMSALLFALTFLLIGSSDMLAQEYHTLPEIKVQAAQGWHEIYTDKYGRTIPVDIEIDVFGENTTPILKLVYAEHSIIPGEWDNVIQLNERNTFITIAKNNPHRTISAAMLKQNEEKRTAFYSYGKAVEAERKYGQAYGNDLTLNEMYSHLKGMLEQLGVSPDEFVFNQPAKFEVLVKANQTTGKHVTPAFYLVELWRQFRGLPVLDHASVGFQQRGWPNYQPGLHFSMSNPDSYQLILYDMKEAETLAEDIPLCAVDKVIESVEAEIQAGRVRKVFSVRFGYALYNDPNFPKDSRSSYDAMCYYAVPSWMVDCIYIENPNDAYQYEGQTVEAYVERSAVGYKRLVINAQTGKALDPLDNSKDGWGNADYQGFISWDDAN